MGIGFCENVVLNLDDSAISASSEASDFPVERVKYASPARKWRSNGDTSEHVTLDLGASTEIDTVAILSHNLTSGATIELKTDDNSDFSAAETVVLTWHAERIIEFFTSKTKRYWRVAIQDASNPDDYIEAGLILLGKRSELDALLPRGWQNLQVDPSVITIGAGGQEFVRKREKYQKFTVSFSDSNPLSPDDTDIIKALLESVGSSDPLLIAIKDGSVDDHSLWGRFENYADLKEITPNGRHTWSFTFREVL